MCCICMKSWVTSSSYRGKTSYIGTQEPLNEFSKLIGFSRQNDDAESPISKRNSKR